VRQGGADDAAGWLLHRSTCQARGVLLAVLPFPTQTNCAALPAKTGLSHRRLVQGWKYNALPFASYKFRLQQQFYADTLVFTQDSWQHALASYPLGSSQTLASHGPAIKGRAMQVSMINHAMLCVNPTPNLAVETCRTVPPAPQARSAQLPGLQVGKIPCAGSKAAATHSGTCALSPCM